MATKKISIQKRVDNWKDAAKNIHDSALQASDNLVEGSLSTGAKWQKLMAKALNEGTGLFAKQQDLTLETLEEIKTHYISANKRFRKLFDLNIPASKSLKAKKATTKGKVEKKAKMTKAANAKSDVAKDNLKNIEGIGPKIATLLNEAGITTFNQLYNTNIKDLKVILEKAGPRFKMHDPKTWRAQAKRLMK